MNVNAMFNAVMELDLDPIKAKLMHVASGEGWSREKTDAVETEYRRFLCLMKMYPDEETAPMADVDTFWHYHILDTMKYARDCEQAFGYFLHHYPYVGMRGGNDDQFRIDSGDRMRALYEATFGAPYPGRCEGETAFCAGPSDKQMRAKDGVATAFCAGPSSANGSSIAFCAGPSTKHIQLQDGAATAFCAGPSVRSDDAAASCAIPAGTCAG